MYVIDKCFETGFMTLKAIGIEIVFDTTKFSLKDQMIIKKVVIEIFKLKYLRK